MTAPTPEMQSIAREIADRYRFPYDAALAALIEASERAAKMVEAECRRIKLLCSDELGPTDIRLACGMKLEEVFRALQNWEHFK